MSVHTCAYKRVVDLCCYGLFFMATALGFGLYLRGWLHQAMFVQVLVLPRRLRQPFLLDDLSTRLGHPDNSRHRSTVTRKKMFLWCLFAQTDAVFIKIISLTFPVLVLLAHRPHADLFVDHIHAGETASEIEQRHGYCKTDLWFGVMTPW